VFGVNQDNLLYRNYIVMKYTFLNLFIVFALVLTGCTATRAFYRSETAQRLAAPAYMVERQIPAGQFILTAFERLRARGDVANIYIEGDGQAWLSKSMKSGDPTPVHPLALHLASKDSADNVIYLARPCQYTKGKGCHPDYWGQKRFAPEVINAYVRALDNIKAHYGIRGFHVIGYSGGGAVATLLAAERDDVLSLRTVAGNLDHTQHSALHGVSVLGGSLNPVDHVSHLRTMPQLHFVGQFDEIVPESIARRYMDALGDTNCAKIEHVADVNHEDGWVNRWPELLRMKPVCASPITSHNMPVLDDWEPMPSPIHTKRPGPSKP
jgi:hypothetical protein